MAKVSSPEAPPSGLSEEVKTKEEKSSSPSSSTPPTATSATVTTATVPVLTRAGVKRAAEDPPVDTGSRDPQDDDDAAMDEFCVLERFDKLRDQAARNRTSIEELEMKLKEELLRLERDLEGNLDESRQQLYKAHNELSETLGCVTKHLTETILSLDSKDFDLVAVKDLDSITKYNGKVSTITFGLDTAACRTGVPGNHHAARGYRVHWDSGAGVPYSTAGKSVVWNEGRRLLVAETAEGSTIVEPNCDVHLQDQAESGDYDGKKEAPPGPKEPEKKYERVDVAKKRKREKLESRFVEHKGALDNQPYNAKQLVDNMNKNKVLKQILIKEKVDAKAEVTDFSMQSLSALVQINEKHSRSLTILTELSKNEQSRPTLADCASNLINLENPMM